MSESQQRLDHDRANAGMAARQTGGLEDEDQAYRGRCERRSRPGGVGEHQPGLEFAQALVRDALPGEQAEARIDAIGGIAARDDVGDGRRCGFDRLFPAGSRVRPSQESGRFAAGPAMSAGRAGSKGLGSTGTEEDWPCVGAPPGILLPGHRTGRVRRPGVGPRDPMRSAIVLRNRASAQSPEGTWM